MQKAKWEAAPIACCHFALCALHFLFCLAFFPADAFGLPLNGGCRFSDSSMVCPMRANSNVFFVIGVGLLLPPLAWSQEPLIDAERPFTKSEAMIAMRDGVKLHTLIYVPKAKSGPLPFIMMRTPYGIDKRGPSSLQSYMKDLADE